MISLTCEHKWLELGFLTLTVVNAVFFLYFFIFGGVKGDGGPTWRFSQIHSASDMIWYEGYRTTFFPLLLALHNRPYTSCLFMPCSEYWFENGVTVSVLLCLSKNWQCVCEAHQNSMNFWICVHWSILLTSNLPCSRAPTLSHNSTTHPYGRLTVEGKLAYEYKMSVM